MLKESISNIANWLRRAFTEPFQELNRWQQAARSAYTLGRFGANQLKHDRAPQMAAALAFRTLFGLAPVVVVGTILMKALRGPDAILSSLHDLLVAAGLDRVHVVAVPGTASETDAASVTLAQWLEDLTAQLANTNLSGIGWIGFVVIVYAAIGLMVTIENSFNIIYRTPNGRPWTRRVPLYWFVLTVGPLAYGLATYVNGYFESWIASVGTYEWLLHLIQFTWSFAVAWLFVFGVYKLVPNATVAIGPATVGALVTTVLLGIAKETLGAFLGGAFSINQLYGSLGLVPLFMFWVYLIWLAVLFGLQVSAILQMLGGRELNELEYPKARVDVVDPSCVLSVMEIVAEHFAVGRPVTYRQLTEITSMSNQMVIRIVDRLVQEGWLHRIDRPEPAVSMVRPPEQVSAADITELGFRMIDESGQKRPSALFSQFRDAQRDVATGKTISQLVCEQSSLTST